MSELDKRKALRSAYEIKKRRTNSGKRKAILKWCANVKKMLGKVD